MTAAGILTGRILRRGQLDLAFAVLVPVSGLIGLALLLRDVIPTGTMSYEQYILPAIVVQAMMVGALTTADRAAWERVSGLGSRMRTLPISRYAPLIARMNYCLVRGLLGLVAAILGAYVLGFRFTTGVGYFVAFVLLSLLLTLAVSFGAEVIGNKAGRPEVASQLLLIPQVVLVVLSTGLVPVDAFPDWVHPFVQYQPISVIIGTLRGFTSGDVAIGNLFSSLAWCVGLLVLFGVMAVRLQGRES